MTRVRREGVWHYEVCVPSRRSLCLFWRETKQRPELEISDETGSGEGKAGPREATGASWQRNPERVSWRRETQRQSTTEGRGEWSDLSWLSGEWQSQQKSKGRLLRPDELHRGGFTNARRYQHCWCLFVEVSRKIPAGDCIQMHGECKV